MPNRHEIENGARRLLENHGLVDMVVDPVSLANRLGVRVFNAKFGEEAIHGLLAVRGGARSIYVNADDSPVRKRFTVAHEIAHLVLHFPNGDVEIVDNADSFRTTADPDAAWTLDRRREWEANTFAASLLMPEALVRKQWNEVSDLEGLARWFQVSRAAMGYRLAALGIEDV